MGPAPAVAAVRLAVRALLADLVNRPAGSGDAPPAPVLVACSGGADSLALLAATVFEAGKLGVPVIGATVDHGLQDGSAARADAVVSQMKDLGAGDAVAVRVRVDPAGQGIEAAARAARYDALERLAAEHGSSVVLLGHTRDDQAETVLLGLTRGSGGRSLAGMPRARGLFHRPLLELSRDQTEAACRAQGLPFWSDPHNGDPRFTRARIRHLVLPMLESELGPGVAAALARTADMIRADVEALDRLAGEWYDAHRLDAGALDVSQLAALYKAIRLRVLRIAAVAAGTPAGELFRVHVLQVDRLVSAYTGQRRIELPGPVHVVRTGNLLRFHRP